MVPRARHPGIKILKRTICVASFPVKLLVQRRLTHRFFFFLSTVIHIYPPLSSKSQWINNPSLHLYSHIKPHTVYEPGGLVCHERMERRHGEVGQWAEGASPHMAEPSPPSWPPSHGLLAPAAPSRPRPRSRCRPPICRCGHRLSIRTLPRG